MGYKILNDDIYDDSTPTRRAAPATPRRAPARRVAQSGIVIQPLHIHLFIISMLVLALLIYFITGLDFNNNEKSESILLIGILDNFNESFIGDIKISSTDFVLKTKGGTFSSSSNDVVLSNFTGNIMLLNESIVFSGKSEKVEYGKNVINIDYQYFELISLKKTDIELFYDQLNLTFKEGRIKVDDKLNFEFKNSTIVLNDFNSTFSFDGIFSFTGVAKSFILNSLHPNLDLSYESLVVKDELLENE